MMSGRGIAVVWTVGGRRYAFPLEAVIEVVRPLWVTPVPDAPEHVLGVIQLRQAVVPVFDLRARFDRTQSDFMYMNRFVIVRVGDRSVALVVDEVIDLVEFGESDVHGRDAFATTTLPPVVAAVLRLDGQLVALLDLSSVVTASDLERVDAAILAMQGSREPAPAASPGQDQADEDRA